MKFGSGFGIVKRRQEAAERNSEAGRWLQSQASDHSVDYICGRCDTILLHADEGQVHGIMIRCTTRIVQFNGCVGRLSWCAHSVTRVGRPREAACLVSPRWGGAVGPRNCYSRW
jgi:hypothetical protein